MIGLGQDSQGRIEKFYKNASSKEILELHLRMTLSKIEEMENYLDSLKKNLLPSSKYRSNEERINSNTGYIAYQDAKKQVLENLIYSDREIISIKRGNTFQSLLRSSIIIISSVFIAPDSYDYQKLDKFCTRFSPSFGMEFTNTYALEILQYWYLDQQEFLNYNNIQREIFNDTELDYIFGGIDVSYRDNSRNQRYSYTFGNASLNKIADYTRYFLYFLVLFIVIRYFPKSLFTRIKSLSVRIIKKINLKAFFWVYPIIMVIGLPIFYLFRTWIDGNSPEFSDYMKVYDEPGWFIFGLHLLTISPFVLFHLLLYTIKSYDEAE